MDVDNSELFDLIPTLLPGYTFTLIELLLIISETQEGSSTVPCDFFQYWDDQMASVGLSVDERKAYRSGVLNIFLSDQLIKLGYTPGT